MEYAWEYVTPWSVVGSITITIATSWAVTYTSKVWKLRRKRKQKRAACQAALKILQERLDKAELAPERREEIASWSLNELVSKLQSDQAQAVEVLQTYQHLALEAHKKTNCLTEPLLEADSQAQACDDNSSGKKGALHGLPISLKDNYGVQGYDCTAGCSVYIGQPYAEDCVLVKVLKIQGAIPFVKTNVPTTMISWETHNPIFGPTTNPVNQGRGVGGSSGGEGALLRSGGSVLGMGSDIGGSGRIPAALCGVYALKPTVGRLSDKGMFAFKSFANIVLACPSPMARDVDSLVTVMRALLVPDMFELDHTVPPLPFNEQTYSSKRPLRIGYYTQDGFFQAVPSCERAVLQAKAALEKMGHELVPVTLAESTWTLVRCWGKSLMADQGQMFYDLLQHEHIDSSSSHLYGILMLKVFVRRIMRSIFNLIMPRIAIQFEAMSGLNSVSEWWDLASQVQSIRQKVMEDWHQRGLDAVICPGFGCPALPFDYAANASGAASYTLIFNLLNLVVGSVPVSRVTQQDVQNMASYPQTDIWDWTVKKGMQDSEGLPVGVQVATLPWQEELCLRVMKELQQALE